MIGDDAYGLVHGVVQDRQAKYEDLFKDYKCNSAFDFLPTELPFCMTVHQFFQLHDVKDYFGPAAKKFVHYEDKDMAPLEFTKDIDQQGT